MRKVGFYTLGCKLNFSETSTLARQFSEKGFQPVEFYESADVYVINTCSVTENADKKCRKVVSQALRQNPQAYIVVVGCYAQLKPESITQIPGVDAVLGAAEKFQLLEYINDFTKQPKAVVLRNTIAEVNEFIPTWSLEERTRSFLKVQDGCDYKCSFCTIPLARGQSRSDTLENVLRHAQELAANGVKEIVLSGINLGDYGKNMPYKLLDLIRHLDETVVDVPRFRVSSIEPNLLSDEIIQFVAESQRFMPHFHVPLQSGSDKILAGMRRRYQKNLYAERVHQIKRAMPHACIGVDVIVGFPGETPEDFLETYQFLNELDISYLHVFPYSERANTLASTMDGTVPLRVREERSQMLRQLSNKKKRFFYEQFLQTQRPVLLEKTSQHGKMEGFTDNYIKVVTSYDPLLANELVPVVLEKIDAAGEMVGVVAEYVV